MSKKSRFTLHVTITITTPDLYINSSTHSFVVHVARVEADRLVVQTDGVDHHDVVARAVPAQVPAAVHLDDAIVVAVRAR